MQYILSLLPVLACPVGMGLMMWMMMRGNKNKEQATYQAGKVPISTYSQPREVTNESPGGTSIFKMLSMCLNWKVVAGLAVVGLIVLVVAPPLMWAALPILLIAACPLSMLFIMRGMAGNRNATTQMQGDQLPAGLTRNERLAELQTRMSSMQDKQEASTRQIAEIESPEVPIVSEAEAVASEASERNRKSTANRRRE